VSDDIGEIVLHRPTPYERLTAHQVEVPGHAPGPLSLSSEGLSSLRCERGWWVQLWVVKRRPSKAMGVR
jgi:hypothetical protein